MLLINPFANVFIFGDFTSTIMTGEPILVELIDLVSSVIISNDLTQMVNFPTQISDCDSHSPALLDFFLSSDASICSTTAFPPLGNSDHTVVSVSIDFPSNTKRDAAFHRTDCDGLRYHLRDMPWKNIFKLSASVAASEFCEWVQAGIDVDIPHLSTRSSLTYLHGFQLLALLP